MVHMATSTEWRSVLWNVHTTEIATVPPVGMLGICTEETATRYHHTHNREGFHVKAVQQYVDPGVKQWKDLRKSQILCVCLDR